MYTVPDSPSCRQHLRYGKRATKNMQLVLQHCCKTSCKATLRVLYPASRGYIFGSQGTRFATLIKYLLHQNRLLTGLSVDGKTCNIAFQLVLQHCCKTNCMFFVARFSVPLTVQLPGYVHILHVFFIFSCRSVPTRELV